MPKPIPESIARAYDNLSAVYAFIPRGGVDITMSSDLGPVEGLWDTQAQLKQISAVLHLPNLETRMSFRMPWRERNTFIGVIVTKTLVPEPLMGLSSREVDVCIGNFLRSSSVFGLIEDQLERWEGSQGFTSCTLSCEALRNAARDKSKRGKSRKWTYMQS